MAEGSGNSFRTGRANLFGANLSFALQVMRVRSGSNSGLASGIPRLSGGLAPSAQAPMRHSISGIASLSGKALLPSGANLPSPCISASGTQSYLPTAAPAAASASASAAVASDLADATGQRRPPVARASCSRLPDLLGLPEATTSAPADQARSLAARPGSRSMRAARTAFADGTSPSPSGTPPVAPPSAPSAVSAHNAAAAAPPTRLQHLGRSGLRSSPGFLRPGEGPGGNSSRGGGAEPSCPGPDPPLQDYGGPASHSHTGGQAAGPAGFGFTGQVVGTALPVPPQEPPPRRPTLARTRSSNGAAGMGPSAPSSPLQSTSGAANPVAATGPSPSPSPSVGPGLAPGPAHPSAPGSPALQPHPPAAPHSPVFRRTPGSGPSSPAPPLRGPSALRSRLCAVSDGHLLAQARRSANADRIRALEAELEAEEAEAEAEAAQVFGQVQGGAEEGPEEEEGPFGRATAPFPASEGGPLVPSGRCVSSSAGGAGGLASPLLSSRLAASLSGLPLASSAAAAARTSRSGTAQRFVSFSPGLGLGLAGDGNDGEERGKAGSAPASGAASSAGTPRVQSAASARPRSAFGRPGASVWAWPSGGPGPEDEEDDGADVNEGRGVPVPVSVTASGATGGEQGAGAAAEDEDDDTAEQEGDEEGVSGLISSREEGRLSAGSAGAPAVPTRGMLDWLLESDPEPGPVPAHLVPVIVPTPPLPLPLPSAAGAPLRALPPHRRSAAAVICGGGGGDGEFRSLDRTPSARRRRHIVSAAGANFDDGEEEGAAAVAGPAVGSCDEGGGDGGLLALDPLLDEVDPGRVEARMQLQRLRRSINGGARPAGSSYREAAGGAGGAAGQRAERQGGEQAWRGRGIGVSHWAEHSSSGGAAAGTAFPPQRTSINGMGRASGSGTPSDGNSASGAVAGGAALAKMVDQALKLPCVGLEKLEDPEKRLKVIQRLETAAAEGPASFARLISSLRPSGGKWR
ncbi:hypothetical protein HYH03_000505 [Edaphochlamys debaryana]|uniref:Uncharacterized protein n=1 Tax=Edaphochlamys debaryana TaxID=47281 RepID=A0A835YQI1_9CHLO|nr:hypothetical protein HYH03_000505 [Edaphochlamys debaryana]|eukprot:KAG2502009.1 hypothetical protein HYH03_000505 [Edaphochlamys debaryana]